MKIDDIKVSISELSDTELMLLLKNMRGSRRISKKEIRKTASKAKPKESSLDISTLLGNMSKEQIGALINKLQNQGG